MTRSRRQPQPFRRWHRCRSRRPGPALACLALTLLIAGCQTAEPQPPVRPAPPPPVVKVIPEPPPTREALAPVEQPAIGRPGYDAELARALRRGPAAPPPEPGTARACLLVPLSGSEARVGTAMQQAAILSFFENGRGRLELLPYNTAGQAGQTARAAQLALADGCALFLGPLLAADVQTVAPLAAERGVPVIAFSSDRRVASENVFVFGLTPQAQVERVLRFAAAQGRHKLAILAPNDPYGATVLQTAKALAAELPMTVVAAETYPASATEFADIVRRLPTTGRADAAVSPPTPAFDALLIADGGARLRAIAAQLPAHGIIPPQVQILGTGLWDEPGLGEQAALVGAWYAAPDPMFRRDFESAYRSTFGAAPHRLATLAYDATAMAALLAPDAGAKGAFSRAALTDPSGFLGRDGLFRLTADGLADRRLAVMQVAPGQTTVISAPELSFAGS
ncbi:MAG: penicillin-binding protein activator [Rhodospirillales bacterium]|nr:penicillin-binding protein activator [Rhodospirillales bacterium]